MSKSVDSFIRQCQQSSQAAYAQFKQLLDALDQSETRLDTFKLLMQLRDYFEQHQPQDCHFQFLRQNILDEKDQTQSLILLQFPSTFLPEEWSFTFYEGLVRYPHTEYHNKSVVELGCGIGWITIALAMRYSPQCIYGLDINPKAIVCARLNLYLNALNEDGSVKTLSNGKSLLDVVNFYESNLFDYFTSQEIIFDRIIGCIPQVLNPEPEVMENLIAENSSDEYLHSLSNYFAKQGFIEDQFGLGLIASAVEQSIPLLRSNGKLILNLGGRPGRSVLERLMRRRGFKVRRVWQTQVEQAADTEIDALVDIEKNTGHRFEFYMSATSDVPIDASTALEYAKQGGKIYHSVDVYEAKMLFPEQVRSIFESVDAVGDESLRSAIDLTYDKFADAEERYSFLAFLASKLQSMHNFPYLDAEGLSYFRQQLAEYFRYYLRVDLNEQQVVVTPGRRELVASLFNNYQPGLTLVEKSLVTLIEKDLPCEQMQILRSPSQIEYLIALMEKLKPALVITKLEPNEIQSSHMISQLIECASRLNIMLVIDLTEHIDLSSQPEIHGVYRFLSERQLSPNLIIMAALVNNRVYQNYTLNFTLINNPSIVKHLVDAAELTYSRTPLLKQFYYAHLLEELLFFQRTRPTTVHQGQSEVQPVELSLSLSKSASSAFSHPAIAGNHLGFNKDTVRLDFGENEMATPTELKSSLFESYLVRKTTSSESSVQQPIRKILARRFNIPKTLYSKVVCGNGVAPIFAALLNLCVRKKANLIIPSGSYGYFKAATEFKELGFIELTTEEKDQFKITPQQLENCLANNPGSWLFLNAPIINPTGVIYSQAELSELLKIAAAHKATVIMDCIFSGLEFTPGQRWDIAIDIERFTQTKDARLVIIGGISKEFAAGGLRFGYSWSTSKSLQLALEEELPHQPHFTLSYAVRKIIEQQLSGEHTLLQHLQSQSQTLAERARRLTQVLEEKGWQVIEPQGGLFLVAKPKSYIEQKQLELTEAGDQITAELFEQQNLVINNSTWTGLPGYCRFVLSCSEKDFELALQRIKSFS